MTETDPVAYLRARHARAEQLARACPPGQSLLPEPADVLARVAAERQILAEHANEYGDCKACGRASDETNGLGFAFFEAVDWPCRTVRLLAAGWGWTEET